MKFMLFFKGGIPQPQYREAHNLLWQELMEDLRSRGALESGAPFGEAGKKITMKAVSDWRPEKEDLTGYMVLNVPSMEEAVAIAKKAPHANLGGSTVIRACVVMEPAVSIS
jgi:hypothetical protein